MRNKVIPRGGAGVGVGVGRPVVGVADLCVCDGVPEVHEDRPASEVGRPGGKVALEIESNPPSAHARAD